MANSLNKVQLIGNLTNDPEIRETPNGQKVANFSLATNRSYKDANGEWQDIPEFHNCVAWRGLADILEQYTSKGKKIYVEGYLQTRSWDDTATGQKRYKTEIVAENIILLGARGDSSNSSSDFGAVAGDIKPTRAKAAVEEEISIEDIPF